MGMDLRLLPVDSYTGPNGGNCHTILNCPRDYDMFEQIRAVGPLQLPAGHDFTAHTGKRNQDGEPTYGRLTTDAYGELYTWLRAGILGPILWKHHAAHPVSSYITALPPDTVIVLDWH